MSMQLASFNHGNDFPTALWSFNDTVNRLIASDNQVRPWSPAVDIFETENELIFRVDTPDVNLAHIKVQVENRTLTLQGERSLETDDRVKGYHRIERSYGAFARSFTLPETIDAEAVRAEYAQGVLTITLAKKAVAKARAITVNVPAEAALTGQPNTM
jgi:HSP20 family protein